MQHVRALPNPEVGLVLLSACGRWADEAIRELVSDPSLDWGRVSSFAISEQGAGVLSARLSTLGLTPGGPGAEAAETLAQHRQVESFRMDVLEDRLWAVLEALEKAGIDAVLLKGSAIALSRFGALRERPMADIDLLVDPDAALQAHTLAKELGWVERGGGYVPEMYEGMQHLLPLVAQDGLGFGLEIHAGLFPDWSPFRFSAEMLSSESVPLDRGRPGRIPTSQHLALHDCLHFAWSHAFRRGVWKTVRDLDVLLGNDELDADRFGALARETLGATCAYWTLSIYRALTGSQRADELIQSTDVGLSGRLEGPLARHLRMEAVGYPEAPGTRTLRRRLWEVAIRPRRSGHGRARPWSETERWRGTERHTVANTARERGLLERFRGLASYLGRLLGTGSSRF